MRNENGGSLAAARSVNERWAWWASKKNRNTPSVWHRQYQNMKCVKTIESKMVSFMHRAFLSAACYQPTYNILFSYGEHNKKKKTPRYVTEIVSVTHFNPLCEGRLCAPESNSHTHWFLLKCSQKLNADADSTRRVVDHCQVACRAITKLCTWTN